MKNILVVVLASVFSLGVIAQQPRSDATYEQIIKEYTLNEDGSMDFHYYKKIELNTHYSFNRLYGETFIVYDPNYQELKINKAIVTQKDGKVVPSPENAFNEVLPRFAANAPYFNHLREMVVTHAGLELEAVIELDYTIHTKNGFYPEFMADNLITESSPIMEKIISIKVPANKNLHYRVFNLRTGPEILESEGFKEYKFTFKGIKEMSHEYYQPHNQNHLPRLVFSTYNLSEAQQFLSNQEALNYKVDKDMQDALSEIKEDSVDMRSRILKIQKLVTDEINTYKVPPVYSRYLARHPIDVWKSNGGTPFEKSILLVTLFREAGIHAEPLAIIPTNLCDENIGCLDQISKYYVQVNPYDDKQMILSPTETTEQNLIYSLTGHTMLELNPSKLNVFANTENYENQVSMTGEMILDSNMKFTGNVELTIFEKANPHYKIIEDSSHVKKLIGGGLSKEDIKSFELINCAQVRSSIKYNFEKKDSLRNQSNYFFFDLPNCKNGTENWHINYLNPNRDTEFEIPFPVSEHYDFTIMLPEDIKLVNPAENIEVISDFGEVIISIVQEENAIVVKRMLRVSTNTVPVSSFADFKEMLDIWNDKKYRELILKK